ncbi:hypothetical protein [Mycobacteroides chelonae]|uniref:hypothetical protein n=1 Tax=Mycobacteroides chelonae TaxID=1774 RepID=UPI0008AA0DCE|nr:hypothetical protein [Mycobacteroides chelonae]AYM42059.1 hypothetical protein DYE20_11270 [[Mycobacterium] chelonae subsp. gwanakae]OHU17095.1 hypothetical protein BKG75_00280 [Mycobacteroides chelonae]
MTGTINPSPAIIERMLDDWRASNEGYSREYAHVKPPHWAVEIDDWTDHGSNGDNVLRACQTKEHLIDGRAYVYGLGMQRPDGTFDDLKFFIHPDSDGVTPSQARSLATALIALADEIEAAK